MKKLLSIVAFLLGVCISSSFSPLEKNKNSTPIDMAQLTFIDSVYYTKDTNKLFSGPVYRLGNNKQVIMEGFIENGKIEGLWTYYFNGEIFGKVMFNGGEKNGLSIFYTKSGKVETYFQNGIEQGICTVYNNYTGLKIEEYSLVNGLKNGVGRKYHLEKGYLLSEQTYVNDELEGETRIFNHNGKPILIIQFKNNKANGLVTAYTEDGVKLSEGYMKNGVNNGVWISWDPITGKKTTKIIYKNGDIVETKVY